MLKEIINERDTREKRFSKFMSELANLCLKYGVDLRSSGGVYILSDDEMKKIDKVTYSDDYTSGDLKVDIKIKEN